ncbi:MAG: hypothetical protein M3380_03980 [Chloroflexota bacterium]|nr:hypothetical protein [Chloroflexota bacterium]
MGAPQAPHRAELAALILRPGKENSTWGYGKLEGELGSFGHHFGRSTSRAVLKRQRVPAAPERAKRRNRRCTFLHQDQDAIRGSACVTVETAWLQPGYILFCIERGSRRGHLAGCTASPTRSTRARSGGRSRREASRPVA